MSRPSTEPRGAPDAVADADAPTVDPGSGLRTKDGSPGHDQEDDDRAGSQGLERKREPSHSSLPNVHDRLADRRLE
jgi:hypothetical protein